jgi:hypothetical protein
VPTEREDKNHAQVHHLDIHGPSERA